MLLGVSVPSVLFECLVVEEREMLLNAELGAQADSENNFGGSSDYVLHRTGCAQRDDQFLHEGCSWLCAEVRQDRRHSPSGAVALPKVPSASQGLVLPLFRRLTSTSATLSYAFRSPSASGSSLSKVIGFETA